MSQVPVVAAAGGVVFRQGPDGVEVLLVHKRQPDEWRVPKGKIREGESTIQAAVREVKEEGGVDATPLCELGTEEHAFLDPASGQRKLKRTVFFLMKSAGGHARPIDNRFDQAVWLAGDEALQRLTFDNERAIVRRALAALSK